MYEQDKTTNTWDCINAIPNSSPEKAIINASVNKPSMKKINPEFIILYVNPLISEQTTKSFYFPLNDL